MNSIRNGTIAALLNHGDGTFAQAQSYDAGYEPRSIATGDFNGDQKIDLTVVNKWSRSAMVLLNRGDGTFGPGASYDTGLYPLAVTAADVNGDRLDDLAVLTGRVGGFLRVLLNGATPPSPHQPVLRLAALPVTTSTLPPPTATTTTCFGPTTARTSVTCGRRSGFDRGFT